jgi:hypothetical protein
MNIDAGVPQLRWIKCSHQPCLRGEWLQQGSDARSLTTFRTESSSDLEPRLRPAGVASDLIAGAFKLLLSRIAAMVAACVEREVGS